MFYRIIIFLFISMGFTSNSHSGAVDLIYQGSFEPTFLVGGTTTTSNVVLKLNQYDDYMVLGIGDFVIPYPVENGSEYTVEVVESSGGHLCSVQNNTGVISNNDVNDVDVNCGLISTIYDVKQEFVTDFVSIENLIVTECHDNDGYWVQTIPGDDSYNGDDYSGSYVHKAGIICSGVNAEVKVGDRVTLNPAQADDFFGQIQMTHKSLIKLSSNNTLPEPVITSVSSLSGLSAVPLEGVLVKIENLIVSQVQVTPGITEPSPSNNFVVNDLLIVDDVFYLTQPFPEIDDTYDSITGISIFRHMQSKLLPRFSQDAYFSTDGVTNLVINEVDYNQPGNDENEYIEIMNPSNDPISLDGVTLYFINGSLNIDYAQIDLTSIGTLLPGQYLVIGSSNMVSEVANGALTLEFENPESQIQNGDPDGLVLYSNNLSMVIDSLSYGGDIPAVTLSDIGVLVNVTENSGSETDSNSIEGSIARIPNGYDSNLNDQDFKFTRSKTPGAYNTFVTSPELLVINEIDYSNPGPDEAEFIEIYNPSMSAVSLENVSLYLINGSNNIDYMQIDFSSLGVIQAGQYLVVGTSGMISTVAEGALRLVFEGSEGQIQNGDPEGMVLFDKNSNTVIDSMSYGSNIAIATLSDLGIMVPVTENSATVTDSNSTDGSIARVPNGVDTNDNGIDFIFLESITPGDQNSSME